MHVERREEESSNHYPSSGLKSTSEKHLLRNARKHGEDKR